ncbi:Dicer-like protein 2 [Saxophila tyrrhenica]|uniref:Dicer-like protein 2 n=1 Tax=Saxophila tyrrhenica TaxID=1690608 RepID=A0AAV9PPB2_9PEZI|nr:Dicer-like protein 2 [Saxophila tyrrhenica]
MASPEVTDDEVCPPEVEPIRLRSYQQEMLERGLERNVIVAMDTGSGKTHVAISRIQAELERTTSDKLVWFTTPSVALSMQQFEVISAHLPAYLVKILTGQVGVDAWTDQSIWDAVLTNVRVVVGTPKVLEDALTHGFVTISRLSLLAFDEAHRCLGDSPMNTIMRDFYYPTKARGGAVPHILGLSASPIMSAKSSTLEDIERNLDAVAITPKIHRSELEMHVHPPSLTTVMYSEGLNNPPRILEALQRVVNCYDLSQDLRILELLSIGDEKSHRASQAQINKPGTYCSKQLKTLYTRAKAILEQLGGSAAEWYTTQCIERFRARNESQSLILPDVSEKEWAHLTRILDGVFLSNDGSGRDTPIPPMMSDKVHSLVRILQQEPPSTLRAIVFVEQRAVVAALADLLQKEAELQLSFGTYVGASQYARKSSIADLVDLRQQEQDLIDFREGRKNVMIATNVLEEGIDVSACNLVVCFDEPKNLVSYVQRRGRARQRESKYVVFLSHNSPAADQSSWQRLEAEMKEAYMREREVEPVIPESDEELSSRSYTVPSTGARLTLQNAKAHLYHFCAVASNHAGPYVDVRPEFEARSNGGSRPWTAQVTLPAFVSPSVRTAVSSTAYSSETTAIKDAAFEASVALHKAELVNDNLLPFANEYVPEVGQDHMDQASLMKIAPRESAWRRLAGTSEDQVEWYKHALSVGVGESTIEVLVYLPCAFGSQSLVFDLFWNREITFTARLESVANSIPENSNDQLDDFRRFTHTVLRSMHGTRMPDRKERNFAYIVSPTNGMRDANQDLQGHDSASALERSPPPSDRLRTIRTPYLENGTMLWTGDEPITNEDGEKEVQVTAFPRRKNFLRPMDPTGNEGAAHTAVQSLLIRDCTLDRLPTEYTILAAFVPSIMHRVDLALTAQRMQDEVLPEVCFDNVDLLVQATCAPSANEVFDYNRLEFLGDTILKFYTVRQVSGEHLNWPERYLTLEEHRLVSNATLCKAAERLGLDRFINTKGLASARWRPDYLDTPKDRTEVQREVSSKILADVVEALIGAGYVDGGEQKAFSCLRTLLPEGHWYPHADPISAMLEKVLTMDVPSVRPLEELIGHSFKRPALLLEAITHASFPHNTGLSYERLEFLGDAVLDMLIAPKLFEHPRKLPEWTMSRYHDAIANGKFLSYCCLAFSTEEKSYDAALPTTATGRGVGLQETVRTIHLYDFLRCGAQVSQVKRQAEGAFRQARETIDNALHNGEEYPWPEIMALEAPKFFSDMIESVLGAIYLDSEGDLAACERFLQKLGVAAILKRMLDDHVEAVYPKEQLGILVSGKEVKYKTTASKMEDGKKAFSCAVLVDDKPTATAEGCGNKEEAEARAARAAVRVLEEGRKACFKKRKLDSVTGAEEDLVDLTAH